jgi:hypothetical protein
MPTVLRQGPFRFFFYAADRDEPPHVHVKRDRATAKFWLEPIRMQRSKRLTSAELNDIERIIADHQEALLESWNEYFNG